MLMISTMQIFAVIVVIVSYQVDSLPMNDNFITNYKRVKSFGCEHPQPRAVLVTDEITTGLLGKLIVPSMTVLHRCDHGSGCCLRSEQVCGPNAEEKVEILFYVSYLLETDTHKERDSSYESFTFMNHTRCGCIDSVPRWNRQ